ncbi:hypothetical protein BDV93DRAFT_601151 [Ceratobasidium sp. AG-I]|nr:hypothetical protein BDV93DRAFT_601151 [Ceratobasidium sp. AG-I]
MKIQNLRVRPRKAVANTPCAGELATMLGCWASSGDIKSAGACAEAAKVLHDCMRTSAGKRKDPKPTINYHLARLARRS